MNQEILNKLDRIIALLERGEGEYINISYATRPPLNPDPFTDTRRCSCPEKGRTSAIVCPLHG